MRSIVKRFCYWLIVRFGELNQEVLVNFIEMFSNYC